MPDAANNALSTSTIRVLLADDSVRWRSYLRNIVTAEERFEIVAELSNGLDAAQKTLDLRPDLILLDTSLPRFSGITVARAIRRLCPSTKVILLAQNTDEKEMSAARACGSGYVAKATAQTDLIEVISGVLDARVV